MKNNRKYNLNESRKFVKIFTACVKKENLLLPPV